MDWKAILERLLSRKFIVWVVATVLVFMGKIEGWMWIAITGTYMGVNLADWLVALKSPDNETRKP